MKLDSGDASIIYKLVDSGRFDYINVHKHFFGDYHAAGTPDGLGETLYSFLNLLRMNVVFTLLNSKPTRLPRIRWTRQCCRSEACFRTRHGCVLHQSLRQR